MEAGGGGAHGHDRELDNDGGIVAAAAAGEAEEAPV
jgi:hypothetical protein